jgi:hypothetical protein
VLLRELIHLKKEGFFICRFWQIINTQDEGTSSLAWDIPYLVACCQTLVECCHSGLDHINNGSRRCSLHTNLYLANQPESSSQKTEESFFQTCGK